jgi:hypothetical protein
MIVFGPVAVASSVLAAAGPAGCAASLVASRVPCDHWAVDRRRGVG